MTNREAAELVFSYIRENGFKPHKIEYGNGYFIFDMGGDSVVHFEIKGFRGWKFAMWINTNEEELKNKEGEDFPALQFFCQHEYNIDKFKPSRSYFLVEYKYNGLLNAQGDWAFYEIRDILKMIKRHPLIAFTMDGRQDAYHDGSYFMYNLKIRSCEIRRKLKQWFKDTLTKVWHGSKVWFIKRYKVVDTVELFDENHDGWICNPRYEMRIHFKKLFDDEIKQNEAECKMLDFWFHKNYYNNMSLALTREGVEGGYYYDKEKAGGRS